MISIFIYLLVIAFMVALDIKKIKKPFDEENKPFSIKRDWFESRWDDALVWLLGGAVGAVLSNELAIPAINKYLDWPELAEGTIDYTSIALCTLIGAKVLQVILSKV